ncbi:multidrug resistance-associated protein 4-like [Centruroides sculpturatus]|uniref:multidrug resistance-associated protein 4-like n=1 Tax=Centruroides sculpturatus TaxID=218467 RepID=UPI000C6DFA22|nr:multidrug resistance-associated protein 4-like [Centruroides sculpturatus]
MRLVKMYTWELPFASLIEKIRKKEMKKVKMFIYARGIPLTLGYPVSRLFTCLTFLAIVLSGSTLNAQIVFVTMYVSIFIYFGTVVLFSKAVNLIAEIRVSLKRIQDFLLLQEKENNSVEIANEKTKLNECGIWMKNVMATWNNKTGWTLNGITLSVQPGELLAVIGSVGSGKAINLSSLSLAKSNIGQIVNLLANDVNKFYTAINLSSSSLTKSNIGQIVNLLANDVNKFYTTAVLGDERLNLLNEVIFGMRLVKMYTWELPFASLIEKIRKKEMKKVKMFIYARGIPLTLGYPVSRLFTCLTFLAIVLSGSTLNAQIVFVTMYVSIFIYFGTVVLFSKAVNLIAEIRVSLKRIQDFLLLQEKENNSVEIANEKTKLNECGIWMKNVMATWNNKTGWTLNGITLSVQPGELLAVIGSVGSGKTSLLMSILGEIPIISGTVSVKGKISYSSQEAWIFNGTIRENIIFGEEYQEERYRKVLHITTLEKDIRLFPNGDLTLVGERGVIMSGGQKARINLARALYLDADIFLLDDPLSAVDVPVARHLFQKCIMEYLNDKICILVTHQTQFLNSTTKVLMLNGGTCEFIGSYYEVGNLDKYTANLSKEETAEKYMEFLNFSYTHKEIENNYNGVSHEIQETSDGNVLNGKSDLNTEFKVGVSKVVDKTRSPVFSHLSVSLYGLTQNSGKTPNFTTKIVTINNTKHEHFYHVRELNIYIYFGLISAIILTAISSASLLYELFVAASIKLHNNMFRCIIRTPISFLDNNPSGKILNRFSRDTNSMDDLLPLVLHEAIRAVSMVIGIVVIEGIICPYLFIVKAIVLMSFFLMWTIHCRVLKSIKYLEGKSRSPVFSHLSVSLYGLTTIRAFNVKNKFISTFNEYQDKHTATWFIYVALNRWNCTYCQIICFLNLIATIVVLCITMPSIDAGSKIGLIINYELILILYFQWCIYHLSETEYQMNSVARILNYSVLKSEAAYESSPDEQPPADWPQKGEIEFKNVSLKYSNDRSIVLNNLSFLIKPGEKIGIVGRTGAGKSSIVASLFRMTEPTGIITVDGIDTKNIGLRDLRSKISIIPQDPVLFTGPLRRNIDPFNEYSEEMLWQAIEEVQLKDVIKNLPGGIDTHLTEGGRNFSVGERQLICLARTILCQNKILVMDEATSNIDKMTDTRIQKIIRENFKSCTVLTIAHRLNTIIDSDRVLVLHSGTIQEFDAPYILLNDVNSTFYNLVKNTGKTSEKDLYNIANNKISGRKIISE